MENWRLKVGVEHVECTTGPIRAHLVEEYIRKKHKYLSININNKRPNYLIHRLRERGVHNIYAKDLGNHNNIHHKSVVSLFAFILSVQFLRVN